MPASYAHYSENKSYSLRNIAQKLRAENPDATSLGPFVFMTDPQRTPDPVGIARKLPKGAVVIYRHFGGENRAAIARQLRDIDGVTLLIGNDPELAKSVRARGVHMPRQTSSEDITKIRRDNPDWIITQAAPKPFNVDALNTGLDAIFVSAIFPSKSPSAGSAIGIDALTQITASSTTPIYALGGVTAETAPRLLESGVSGFAAIEGIVKEIVMGEITTEETRYGHRFVYRKKGHAEAELTMARAGDNIFNANHTGVPKSMGGQGVGKALIKVMSDHARENGYTVIPSCPFVAAMFKRKPAWAQDVWEKGV